MSAAHTPIGLTPEQAQLFLDALPQLAWMARADGYVFWCNRRFHEYTGASAGQLEGWNWQAVHDPVALPGILAEWQQSIQTARRFHLEFSLRAADGTFRPFLTRAEPVCDAAGAVVYWAGTCTEIAEQKNVELTLRLALDAAYLVAFVWEIPTNRVHRFHNSDTLLRTTSETPDEYEGVRDQVHPEDRGTFAANVEKALHDPKGAYCSEFRLIGLDGKVRWVFERGQVEFGPEGKPLRLVGLTQDITQRKEAELRLIEAREQLQLHADRLEAAVAERTAKLQEVVEELGTFSYSVAHDLRAPLRTIKGFASALGEEVGAVLPENARDYLRRIDRATDRMETLVRDVLAYSRITRTELTIEDIDPTAVVQDAIDADEALRPPRAKVDIDGPLPPVHASPPAFTQVIYNLLGNAVKFVRPGVTPHVRVRAERNGATVRIWIEDNGIGISPEHQEKIWGMLERVHAEYDGSGVGLSIVRKAVERMGGRVGVVSEVGQGSRFWIELPAGKG